MTDNEEPGWLKSAIEESARRFAKRMVGAATDDAAYKLATRIDADLIERLSRDE